MVTKSIDNYDFFEAALNMLFIAAHTEGTAETIYAFDGSEIIFKRTIEFHMEIIDAITLCLFNGKVRPAYGLLRTLLESCAGFSWMILKYEERVKNYVAGAKNIIRINRIFNELAWNEEYNITYRKLCSFVHGSYTHSEIKKNKGIYDPSHAATFEGTITADYFVDLNPEGTKIIIVDDKPLEEILNEHRKTLEIKVFDIVLAALMRASGSYSDSHRWWPSQELINCFSSFAKGDEFEYPFLWNTEKHKLSICKIEGRYL